MYIHTWLIVIILEAEHLRVSVKDVFVCVWLVEIDQNKLILFFLL